MASQCGGALPTSANTVAVNGATLTVDVSNAVAASITVNDSGSAAGSLAFNSGSQVTVSGAVTLNNGSGNGASIVMTSGGTLIAQSLAVTAAGTFTPGTGTVQLTANNTLPATVFTTFNNLSINGGTTTLGVAIAVNGNLTVTSGTLASSTFNITGNATGTFSMASGTTLALGLTTSATATTFPSTFTAAHISLDPASTVVYQANAAQTISSTPTYGNLTLSTGAAASTKTAGGALTIAGNLNIAATTTFAAGTSLTHNVGGNWTNNGTFSFTTGSTINFNGNNALQTISGSSATAFNNIIVNKGTLQTNILEANGVGALSNNANITLTNGTFKITTGTFQFNAAPTIAATAGLWVNGGTVTAGAFGYTVNGLLRVSGGTLSVGTADGNNINFATGSTLTFDGGTTNVASKLVGSLTTSTTTFSMSSTAALNIATVSSTSITLYPFDFQATGSSFTMSGGTIAIRREGGSGAQDLGYRNLATTTSVTGGTLQIGDASTPVSQTMQINSTAPIFNLTINGTNSPTGRLQTNALTVIGTVAINSGGTLDAATGNLNMTVGGNWSNSGTFSAGTATVTFNSTTPGKTIAGTLTGTSKFNKLSFNGVGGAWSFSNPADVASDFTITNGTVTAPSGNLNVGGNWSNSATFTHNSGTVTFNGTTNQSIGGSNSTTFATLAVSNTGGGGSNVVSLATDTTVNTALNVTNGVFDQGATFNLTTGTVTVSSGATFRNLGTGDLTLSGGVSNAGTMTFDGGGGGCGGADSILIRSSVTNTQRAWSGAGTFSMTDIDVQDQAGTAIITVFSGTNSGNNGSNWIFINSCTGAAGNTYVWVGPTAGNDAWTLATNWQLANSSPATFRITPAVTDVLIFNGSTTPTPTVTAIPTQTIAALRIINNAFPSFSTTAANTLTTDPGAGGLGFDVNNLNITGSNALTIKLNSGTGNVSGTMTVSGGGHRLISNNAAAITFQSGAIFTTSTGFTGNAFGDGSAGNGAAGSVVFASGSSYFHNAGSSPFGASGNPSVVTFQTGSQAVYLTATGFDASGRTYANLVIGKGDPGGIVVNATQSGTGNFQFNNLAINSPAGASSSTLTYTGTGASTVTISGNITSVGAVPGTAADVFLTAGANIIINGGAAVSFGNGPGNTRSIFFGSDATLNSGTNLSLSRLVQMGLSGTNILTDNGTITPNVSTTGYVVGGVKKPSVPASYTFPVGTTIGYTPVNLANATGGGTLTVTPRTPNQPVLSAANSLQEYWTLVLNSGTLTTDMTFNYLQADVMGTESNYRIIVVESGNATNFPADANHSVDTVNNKFTVLGETQFSDWTAGEHKAPTAIKLQSFSATRDSNEVMLQWRTGFEARNLGFNIYREQNGQRTRVTPSLVAGSALKAGRQTVMGAGLSYTWYDHLANDNAGSVTYWLEDVDLNGTRTLHGPIAPSIAIGAPKQGQQMRAQLLSEVSQRTSASGIYFREWPEAFATQQAKLLSGQNPGNDPTPGKGKGGGQNEAVRIGQAPAAVQAQIGGMSGIKIAVSQSGWQRITQPELVAAGLDANANARQLQLYANGVQMPIRQSGDGNNLTASDYLEFYGHGLDSPTDAAQTYYLVLGKNNGLRVTVANQATPAPPSGAQNFNDTVERRDRMIYFSGLLNGDAENFFGDIVSVDPLSQTVPVSHLDASGSGATLEVTLQGVTTQGHSVLVRLNGTDVGTMNFSNTANSHQTFTLPAAALHEGDNTVQLTSMNGNDDVSLVDTLRLTYTHANVADNNSLSLGVSNGNTSRIGGFTNANIRVVDTTNPSSITELTQTASVSSQPNGTYAVDIQVAGATPGNPHTLLIFADGQAKHPDSVKNNAPSSWATQKSGADYLIITSSEFKAAVEPLAELRRQQLLVVNVVDVEDLYDEFSFGMHTPRAVHDFLQTAVQNWKRKPRYVLLVGDASYDPKNYFGQGYTDFVPTKLIDTSLMETASDDWLADFDGDGVADFAIGRLPVRTVADTNVMVNKIISYENTAPDPQRGAMLAADNTFESASDSVRSLLPAAMPVQSINRSSADDTTIHNQIISALNQGPLVANYFGHGSNGVWTGASLLSSPDAETLTNQNHLSLYLMMTCFNGYFEDPYYDSLGEALLKAPGGAVAVWASSSLTEPEGQVLVDQELYRQLFSGPRPALGDAVLRAKRATTDQDVRRTWIFFGDPAMRLNNATAQGNAPFPPRPRPGQIETDPITPGSGSDVKVKVPEPRNKQ